VNTVLEVKWYFVSTTLLPSLNVIWWYGRFILLDLWHNLGLWPLEIRIV